MAGCPSVHAEKDTHAQQSLSSSLSQSLALFLVVGSQLATVTQAAACHRTNSCLRVHPHPRRQSSLLSLDSQLSVEPLSRPGSRLRRPLQPFRRPPTTTSSSTSHLYSLNLSSAPASSVAPRRSFRIPVSIQLDLPQLAGTHPFRLPPHRTLPQYHHRHRRHRKRRLFYPDSAAINPLKLCLDAARATILLHRWQPLALDASRIFASIRVARPCCTWVASRHAVQARNHTGIDCRHLHSAFDPPTQPPLTLPTSSCGNTASTPLQPVAFRHRATPATNR